MKVIAIIPARYNASRFRGKPITRVLDHPMIWWPYMAAMRCMAISSVMVATDDERIKLITDRYAIPCLISHQTHSCGTDRVIEAAGVFGLSSQDIIVNIQCDEVLITPGLLTKLIDPFLDNPELQITTMIYTMPIRYVRFAGRVKVVFDNDHYAMYFSRSVIPHFPLPRRDYCYGHIGVYAFRKMALDKIKSMVPSPLEEAEDLEQLRWMEYGIPIKICESLSDDWCAINEPSDISEAERILMKRVIKK